MAAALLIDTGVSPSGSGCVECLASGGWWFHLRRCAGCGHIGCCDSSPSQHASHHAADRRASGGPELRARRGLVLGLRERAITQLARRWLRPAITRSTSPCRDQWVGCPKTGSDSCTDLFDESDTLSRAKHTAGANQEVRDEGQRRPRG